MAFEMPPRGKTCRLVATSTVEGEIYLSVLHFKDGFIYFPLSQTEKQRKDIQAYIKELQPKILSGIYQAELVNMNEEEAYS